MSYLVQMIQSMAAIFMGLLVTCFAAFGFVSTFTFFRPGDSFRAGGWWRDELVFFVFSIFFLICGFGMVWFGVSFFAPSLAPETFMGTDFFPGLNLLFRGLMGIVFAVVAIDLLFEFDFGCLPRILGFLIFGGMSAWLIWVPWVGLSDALDGTGNLEPLLAKLRLSSQLAEPFIGFVMGMVLLLVMKDGIKAFFSKELNFVNGLILFSYVGPAILLIAASVCLFCVRILHIEALAKTTDMITNAMTQFKDWESTAITIFEWGFAILVGISVPIKKIMGNMGKTANIGIAARMILVIASLVLATLYIAEMI